MQLNAGDFAEALKVVGRQTARAKPRRVNVNFDAARSLLQVEEAAHGLFGFNIPGQGDASFSTQVEGMALQRLIKALPAQSVVELLATPEALVVRSGNFKSALRRYDQGGVGGVMSSPPPASRKHKGQVVVQPEGRRIRNPKGHQWGFSAQVPFPPDEELK